MKEYDYVFSTGLFKGIKNSDNTPINADILTRCYNLEPTEHGLRGHQQVLDLTLLGDSDEFSNVCSIGTSFYGGAGDWAQCWPWPQVRRLNSGVLIGIAPIAGTENLGLFELERVSGQLEATFRQLLGSMIEISHVDISENLGYFLVSVYYTDGTMASWSKGLSTNFVDPIDTTTCPEFISSTFFNGQCILGGLNPQTGTVWEGLDKSSILWGAVGKMEFSPLVDRTAGWVPKVQYGGTIVKVHAMESYVVVFSTEGVHRLIPNSSGYACRELSNAGVLTGRHVGGDINTVVYIDTNFDLWMGTKDGLKNLGYRNLFKPKVGEYIDELLLWNISYDSRNSRFYISNGAVCYVFNTHGMYECHQLISSVFSTDSGELLGTLSNGSNVAGEVTTQLLDLNQAGLKTVNFIEFGGQVLSQCVQSNDVYLGLSYTYNKVGSPVDGPWVLANPEGAAFCNITAQKMGIRFKITDYRLSDVAIQYLRARLKYSDKRFTRGRVNVNSSIT